jgi:tetratricopeptide (TPR) repeat protein
MILMTLVSVVTLWTYLPVLSANASFSDDLRYVAENPLVQNPSWQSAKRFLTEATRPSTVPGYYEPLAMISLMLDYARGGRPEDLRPFRETCLALHVANTLLITALMVLIFKNPWTAAVVGLVFGAHPLTVESVTWVSQRKTLLATFFCLWSLILYVRYARRAERLSYAACIAMFLLALMSKPTATMLPLVLMLMDWWPLGRLRLRTLIEKIPLFVISGLSAVVTVVSQGRTASVEMPTEHDAGRVLLTLCHNIVFYLRKTVWPTKLSVFYPAPERLALSDPMVLAGVIGTCLLVVALLLSLRWTRALVVGWLIFFVAIFPTMGVIGFTHVIAADRYMYLPLIGFLLILGWLLNGLWNTAPWGLGVAAGRLTAVAIGVSLVGLEAMATRGYLAHWRDKESLFRHMLSLTPGQAGLEYGLANALIDKGRIDEGVAHMRASVRLDPNSPTGWSGLASALVQKGKIDEALDCYRRSLRLDPALSATHYGLGALLIRQGNTAEGVEHLRESVRLNPNLAKAHYNLAIGLVRLGRLDEAVKCYREASRLDPRSAETHNNLAVALIKQGQIEQAVQHLNEAIRLKATYVGARKNLASALAQLGRIDQAVEEYRQVIRIDPADADSYCSLGALLGRQGKADQAAAAYREALRIRPDHPTARQMLDAAPKEASSP